MAFTKIAAAGIGSTETVTLHSLEVLNNATVGGVLTYEDVTNVDSIGIVTARAGVLVGSGITLSKDGDGFFTGIVTATTFSGTFSGDGTSLTGVASTDNIRTNTNATFLQNINVSGLTTTGIISAFTNTDGTTDLLTLHADADGTNNGVASIKFTGNAGNHSSYIKGGHTTNGDTILTFHTDTYASGFNPEERVRIDNDGNMGIGTDNPAQAVHINRSSGDSYLRIQGGTNQGTLINKTDGTLIGGFVSGGTVGGSANDIAVRAETGNNIVFAHGTTERLRVDSGGDVAIGVNTNPGGTRLIITDSLTDAFVNPTDSIVRITNSNSSADTNQASLCFTCSTTGVGADSAIVSQADDSSGNSRLEFWTDTNNGMTEKLSIRGSDGRVTVTNDIEFSTSGSGGLFGKFAVTNQSYTANSNLDIALTTGNYIFSVRSGGVYHYNAIFMVTYYDSADKDSHEILHGDYGTTATHTVIHNSNNNGTFRLTFNRNFDGINVRQIKLS